MTCESARGALQSGDARGWNIAASRSPRCGVRSIRPQLVEALPAIAISSALQDVGLRYIARTISGDGVGRRSAAGRLSRGSPAGHRSHLFILDEPTTGLHFEDVRRLLDVLNKLVEQGNTVVVIEHNLDVIKSADWVIDLGPEGGAAGGQVIAVGPPELIAATRGSATGEFLAAMLNRSSQAAVS